MKTNNKTAILIFYSVLFIILTIPRSIEVAFPTIYDVINIFKVIATLLIVVAVIKKRVKLSKLTIMLGIYAVYLGLMTILNRVPINTVIKVYGLNIGILLLCELIFNSDIRDKFVKFFSNYFLTLLIANLVLIIIANICGNESSQFLGTYLLGQDNRFILYIIPTLIGFFYLSKMFDKTADKVKLGLTYVVGTFTVGFLWSVAAVGVLLLLGLAYLMARMFKNMKVNIYVLTGIIVALSIGIVFFRIQNYFAYFIENVLNKSITLSYRTLIWDSAISMLLNSKINLIFGFGYFDTSTLFATVLPVNHLHNLVLNTLFFGGIVGTIIYASMLNCVMKKIYAIKQTLEGKILALLFAGIFILFIFDTFEVYQLYYFILYMLYGISIILKQKAKEKVIVSEDIMKEQKDTVGILLATYNGEHYIKEQLDSIVHQTYQNWVIYISDDHSTDNTMSIIQEYQKQYGDKIVILENESKLSSAKMNFANIVKKVNTEKYYMFCDQDDVWDEEKVAKMLTVMKQQEKDETMPILVYSDLKIVNQDLDVISESSIEVENKYLPKKNLLNHILLENYFPGCVVMFNQALKEKMGEIYPETEMHDWWLTLVVAFAGKIVYIDEPLHLYRQHQNNTIGARQDNNVIKRYFIRFKKLFHFGKMHETWKEYQDIVLRQAEELKARYSQDDNKNLETLDKFIATMKTKSKIKRLILLIKGGYIPREKIRIFRLVI